jgi:hypothetical protein
MCDKTFVKKDLLNIIDIYDLSIEFPHSYSKKDLGYLIMENLEDLYNLDYSDELPEIETADHLIYYLKNPKISNELNYKAKQELIHSAKILLNYSRNGYLVSNTKFKDFEAIYKLALNVSNYCDIPTARRAINEFNLDPKLRNKIEMKISAKVKKEIQQKQINRDSLYSKFEMKSGNYLIKFE